MKEEIIWDNRDWQFQSFKRSPSAAPAPAPAWRDPSHNIRAGNVIHGVGRGWLFFSTPLGRLLHQLGILRARCKINGDGGCVSVVGGGGEIPFPLPHQLGSHLAWLLLRSAATPNAIAVEAVADCAGGASWNSLLPSPLRPPLAWITLFLATQPMLGMIWHHQGWLNGSPGSVPSWPLPTWPPLPLLRLHSARPSLSFSLSVIRWLWKSRRSFNNLLGLSPSCTAFLKHSICAICPRSDCFKIKKLFKKELTCKSNCEGSVQYSFAAGKRAASERRLAVNKIKLCFGKARRLLISPAWLSKIDKGS